MDGELPVLHIEYQTDLVLRKVPALQTLPKDSIEVDRTDASYKRDALIDSTGRLEQSEIRACRRHPPREIHRNDGDGTDRPLGAQTEQSEDGWGLDTQERKECKEMKVVKYGGFEWFLSGWSYTYGAKLTQKYWVSQGGKMSAITIYRHRNRQKYIVQSPDGEILDYGVVRLRSEAKRLTQKALWSFMEHTMVPLKESSPGFQGFVK